MFSAIGTFIKLAVLTVLLNLIRYFAGGPIEAMTIAGPMHAPMALHPDVYDNTYTNTDFALSFLYNYGFWFAAVIAIHLMYPRLTGPALMRSLAGWAIMLFFFVSVAAVYMNHYVEPFRSFYIWSMIDAAIVFGVTALAHGILYPLFFRRWRDY
jgi:hypothetical protein